MVHEVLDLFNAVIEYEDIDFVGIKDFADDVARMVHTTSASVSCTEETIQIMIEMLFGVAAKIKHQPSYLRVWFRPKTGSTEQAQGDITQISRSTSDKHEFPLFYYFLNYIHLDTTAGEFSRTGLIYIIESSDREEALERWIIESDLATLMASGLGALYSQLSRKLALAHGDDSIPAVFALSSGDRTISDKATDPDAPKNDQDLRAFLVYLAFWQDMLEYCSSADVRQTLLDHFEHIFMQQVLYPSMLESSDKDGGSSVAIMAYVRFIIESISYPSLIRTFLQFLFANRITPACEAGSKPTRPAALARRRKSQNLLEAGERSQGRLVPDLFSLVDLVLSSLRSQDQQTVASTLQLASVLLQTQYTYAMASLLRVQDIALESIKYSFEMHEKNLDGLEGLAARLGDFEDSSESTDLQHRDAENLIGMHCTTNSILQLPSEFNGDSSSIPTHTIPAQSPFLICLLFLLEHFFLNDISTNLFLTQTITILACCGRCSLKGWLMTDHDTSDNADPDQVIISRSPKNPPESPRILSPGPSPTSRSHAPPPSNRSLIVAALDHLASQVSAFRTQVADFDTHLSEQKHAFNVWDQMTKETAADPHRKSTDSSTQPNLTLNAKSYASSIPPRLRSSEQSSLTPSRSGSPRGRHAAELTSIGGTSSLTGMLGQLRVSASPSPLRFDHSTSRSSAAVSPMRKSSEAVGAGEPRPYPVVGGMIPHILVAVPVAGGVQGGKAAGEKKAPLSQILTNVIILHEFILELMAVVEVRASLFGEVVM